MLNRFILRLPLCAFLFAFPVYAALDVSPLADASDSQLRQLLKRLVGPDVEIVDSSVRLVYRQSLTQVGSFRGGLEAVSAASEAKSIGVSEGLVLSTGNVVDAMAGSHYSSSKKSTDLAGTDDYSGDNPLLSLSAKAVNDLVLLEFYVIPKNNTLRIDFVFASEEYEPVSGMPDRVCTSADDNDRFGFFISPLFDPLNVGGEKNRAVWASGASIDAISLHPAKGLLCGGKRGNSYVANKTGSLTNYKTSFDGFSLPLATQTDVLPGVPYKIRIALADTGDGLYDSAVFIRFISSPQVDRPAQDYRYLLGEGVLSTHTPVNTVLARVSDPDGPIDQSTLDSGTLPAGVTLNPFNGDISVTGTLTSGVHDFDIRTFDYQDWHPCLSEASNTENPCDYSFEAHRVGSDQKLALSFADADVTKSTVFADKAVAGLAETVLFTVTLKDADANQIISGGDNVQAQSDFGLINGKTGEVRATDLGNGQYQFKLSSTVSGTATVIVSVNGAPLAGNVKVNVSTTPALDSDGDGLPDILELQLGTSPYKKDSDDDGINDLTEMGDLAHPRDSDGDKLIDALDPDDDNDGIPTREEGRGDGDLDRIPNYLDTKINTPDPEADYDGDGIKNAVENAEILSENGFAVLDTDGDFVPNALDSDSDNDGKLDNVEWPNPMDKPLLSDRDVLPDYVDVDDHSSDSYGGDSDGDGLSDILECASVLWSLCFDSDQDGQPDYMEIDSDNDGLTDTLEAGQNPSFPLDSDRDGLPDYRDGDSDNDGIPDAQECTTPLICSDSNNNGIPDYRESSARNVEGETGSVGVVKTQTKGSGSMSGLSVLVLALIGFARQRQRLVRVLLLPLLFVVGLSGARAQSESFYGGAGLGLSQLKPDISETPSLTQDQDRDYTVNLHLGYGYTEHVSLELSWSDLGDATFLPAGKLSYESLSFGALAYYFYKGEARTADSTGLFVSGGLVTLMNTADNISFDKGESISLFYGVGLEHWVSDAWSLRVGLKSYDQDAAEVAVSALYRFDANQ
jgi:hypothetical protein